jgi:malate dehydrogenase (oxaloacetate-decarboxylating)
MKAIEQGLAGVKMSRDELYERAEFIIGRTQKIVKLLMEQEHIRAPPKHLA